MKIGIIGAMDEEVELLKQNLDDKKTKQIAGISFFSGKFGSSEIFLVKSGIGKVNAAVATALLIDHDQPDVVMNTGSAGGFDPSLDVGDIVVATEVRYHDVNVTAFGYEHGQIPGSPPSFRADEQLAQHAVDCARRVTDRRIVRGLIASGDSFMDHPAHVTKVRKTFPEMKAAEMEAAAVAHVCTKFSVPFVVIRALSDIAGQQSSLSFENFLKLASENSARVIIQMIKELNQNDQKNERGKFQSGSYES